MTHPLVRRVAQALAEQAGEPDWRRHVPAAIVAIATIAQTAIRPEDDWGLFDKDAAEWAAAARRN